MQVYLGVLSHACRVYLGVLSQVYKLYLFTLVEWRGFGVGCVCANVLGGGVGVACVWHGGLANCTPKETAMRALARAWKDHEWSVTKEREVVVRMEGQCELERREGR